MDALQHTIKRHPWAIVVLILAGMAFVALFVGQPAEAGRGDGWLGVYIQNIDRDIAEAENLESTDGVLVTGVIDDSPAEKAGLKRGDVIIEFDGRKARSVRRLTSMIDNSDPDEEKSLLVWRDGKETKVDVVIGEDDDDSMVFFDRGNWHFPEVHVPHTPDAPHAPRVYEFSTGQFSTSYIGVSLYELSDQLAETYGAKGGALINEVSEDSPAEEAGLKAGDVIVKMDGRDVDDVSEIREAIQDNEEEDTIEVTVLRNGSEQTFDVGIESHNTWSGIGVPRFDAEPFRARSWRESREDRDDWREAMRDFRDDFRGEWRSDNSEEWRRQLEDAMRELRKELRDLRKDVDDLR